jgi:hypothetical protein
MLRQRSKRGKAAFDVAVLPNLGAVSLATLNKIALKERVEPMVEAGLSPKTTDSVLRKSFESVVASPLNEEGEQFVVRKFLDTALADKR